MNKEEILARARKEPDERMLQIDLKGYRYGMIGGGLTCCMLMLLRIADDESWYDLYAIIGIMSGVHSLYRYHFNNQRSDLIFGLCWMVISFIFIVGYAMSVIK